jgi:hypothetical protein
MPQLYSKNRIMAELHVPLQPVRMSDLGSHSVGVVATNPFDLLPGALKPIASAGRPIARRLARDRRAALSRLSGS